MYKRFAAAIERWLRIPPRPASPPGGEATTEVFRAAPAFYRYRLVFWAIPHGLIALVLLLAFGIAGVILRNDERSLAIVLVLAVIVLGIFALVALFGYTCIRLDYENRWYLLTDRSLRVREGVVSIREMTVTFANIQNIAVEQGPVQRAFGIADLTVETAGGGGGHTSGKHQIGMNLHAACFAGIENAAAIRELMQSRLREIKDAGLGDLDDRDDPAPGSHAWAGASELLADIANEARAMRMAAERCAGRS